MWNYIRMSLLLTCGLWGCSSSTEKPASPVTPQVAVKTPGSPETQWVDPKTLHQGPIQHEQLNDDQLSRIRYLKDKFKEVDPTPLEEWIDDFKRDKNPDNEIRIWEAMAKAYGNYVDTRNLDLETRKEVFQVILLRSGSAEDEVLKHIKLKHLTEKDAREVMAGYGPPKPLTIITR